MTAFTDEKLKAKWLKKHKATKCPTVINIGVTGLSNELDNIIGIDTRCLYDSPKPLKKRVRKKGNTKRGWLFREV